MLLLAFAAMSHEDRVSAAAAHGLTYEQTPRGTWRLRAMRREVSQ